MPNRSDIIESLKIGFLGNQKADNNTLLDELEKINKKLDTITENDRIFRNKLEVAISKIRESNGDIADTLDKLIDDWNNL